MRARDGAGSGRSVGVRSRRGDGDRAAGSRGRSTVGPVSISTLYRGRVRLELLDLLAMGEVTHGDISRSLGCRVADIAAFADEHTREISDIRSKLAHDIALESSAAGLWIASKRARLAEIQADIEDINDCLAELRSPGQPPGSDLGSKRHMNLLRLKLNGLKAAADEIDPPRRGAGRPSGADDLEDRNVVHYVIEGDDNIIASLT